LNWQDLLPQILLAAIAAAPGLYAIFRGRHKDKADVAKAITEAAAQLVEQYKDKIEAIEKTIARQEEKIRCQELTIERQAEKLARQAVQIQEQSARIMALEVEREDFLHGVSALCKQIREQGLHPVWEPFIDN
jgi:septal ring factor EnvC (AmiA/AmiB activator)